MKKLVSLALSTCLFLSIASAVSAAPTEHEKKMHEKKMHAKSTHEMKHHEMKAHEKKAHEKKIHAKSTHEKKIHAKSAKKHIRALEETPKMPKTGFGGASN